MARETPGELGALLAEVQWVRRLARALAGDAADDLTQETLLAAHRRPPAPGRPLRPWLGRIVRNLASARRRDAGRRAGREQAFAALAPATVAATDQAYERLELDRMVVDAVLALEPPLRTVVVLHYFEGLDSNRIGARTGEPAATVRWRLARALERLRATLDRQHGGQRRAWVALALPAHQGSDGLLTTGVWLMTSTKKLVLAAAALALLGWFALRRTGAPGDGTGATAAAPEAPAVREASAALRNGAGPGPPPRWSAAATGLADAAHADPEGTSAGCAEALARVREEMSARETEARALVPQAAFELGTPNPTLRARVATAVARALKDGGHAGHDVECRDWACRVTVVAPAVDSNEVEPRLAAMGKWVPRVRGLRQIEFGRAGPGVAFSFGGRRDNRDVVTQRSMEEYVFFLGQPPAAAEARSEAAPPAVPTSLAECQRALATARQGVARRLAQLAGFRPLATRFAAAAPAPALDERARAAAVEALPDARPEVDCRSGVCRFRFAVPPPPDAAARLEAAGAFGSERLESQTLAHELYVSVATESTPALLARLRKAMRAPGFFAGCPEAPGPGNALLRIVIPSSGETNEAGVYRRASVALVGGSLRDSPAVACLVDRFANLLAAQELPDPIANLLRFESWVFRPGQPPEMVTPPGL